nr:MAG TPA: hypothetical protein [Crassvirales sp.]
MFVDSIKVWKNECCSITSSPHYATFKDISKEERGVME